MDIVGGDLRIVWGRAGGVANGAGVLTVGRVTVVKMTISWRRECYV